MREFRPPATAIRAAARAAARPVSPRRTPPRRWRRACFAGALLLGVTGLPGTALAAGTTAAAGTPAATGITTTTTATAAAEARSAGSGRERTVDYVAFGDSYASGVGGGPALDACWRTAEGYPNLLDALPEVELDGNQACSGATTLTTPPAPPAGPVDLPEQIAAAVSAGQLNQRTDLVTVTISGNDVEYGSVVAACAGAVLPETCAPAIEAAQAYAETAVVPQLQASLAVIREAAPRAELVLTGYPHLFDGSTPGALSVEAQTLFNTGTDVLNALLAEQITDGTFVDVTEAFAGHGIGSPESWIIFEGGPADLHPNAAGYREGYLAATTEALDLGSPHDHHDNDDDDDGRGGHDRGGCRGRG